MKNSLDESFKDHFQLRIGSHPSILLIAFKKTNSVAYERGTSIVQFDSCSKDKRELINLDPEQLMMDGNLLQDRCGFVVGCGGMGGFQFFDRDGKTGNLFDPSADLITTIGHDSC